MTIPRTGREFDVDWEPDATRHLECREGGSEIRACSHAKTLKGRAKDF